ncbi:MAG: hypothetical protein ABIZ72_00180 [Candidatus Limnocylindrales bacterium]
MTIVRDPRRLLLLAAIVVLAGATAFGLWHIVVGGLVNGNPRAGAFGAALATVAGGLLIAVRRARPRQ